VAPSVAPRSTPEPTPAAAPVHAPAARTVRWVALSVLLGPLTVLVVGVVAVVARG
jgi:hypothetical protein